MSCGKRNVCAHSGSSSAESDDWAPSHFQSLSRASLHGRTWSQPNNASPRSPHTYTPVMLDAALSPWESSDRVVLPADTGGFCSCWRRGELRVPGVPRELGRPNDRGRMGVRPVGVRAEEPESSPPLNITSDVLMKERAEGTGGTGGPTVLALPTAAVARLLAPQPSCGTRYSRPLGDSSSSPQYPSSSS